MSRNISGVYSLPAGSVVATGETILPAQHNTPLNDIASDLNLPRPVVAGGTGADNAPDALVNLGLTATAAELNLLDGVTATAAELNLLDGVTATTAELNALDGVTATGTALIQAASALAGRTAIAAQPYSQSASGIGQVVALAVPTGTALVAPAGGTWEFWYQGLTGGGPNGQDAGVTAGGTTVAAADGGIAFFGRFKRIA